MVKHARIGRALKKCTEKHETQSGVFPYFLSALRFLSALQQNTATLRIFSLFYDKESNEFPHAFGWIFKPNFIFRIEDVRFHLAPFITGYSWSGQGAACFFFCGFNIFTLSRFYSKIAAGCVLYPGLISTTVKQILGFSTVQWSLWTQASPLFVQLLRSDQFEYWSRLLFWLVTFHLWDKLGGKSSTS